MPSFEMEQNQDSSEEESVEINTQEDFFKSMITSSESVVQNFEKVQKHWEAVERQNELLMELLKGSIILNFGFFLACGSTVFLRGLHWAFCRHG